MKQSRQGEVQIVRIPREADRAWAVDGVTCQGVSAGLAFVPV